MELFNLTNAVSLIAALAVFFGLRGFIYKYLINSAKAKFKEATTKDEALKKEISEVDRQIEESKSRAEKNKKNIKKVNNSNVPEDWHLKWRKKK